MGFEIDFQEFATFSFPNDPGLPGALAGLTSDEHAARVTLDILELELDDFADP